MPQETPTPLEPEEIFGIPIENQEDLKPGIHGTEDELHFVWDTIQVIRKTGYQDQIYLIGSRAKENPSWVSLVGFREATRKMPPELAETYLDQLNQLAKNLNLSRNQIPKLVDELPPRPITPPDIIDFLETGDPGSDFDIYLDTDQLPQGLKKSIEDDRYGTGQIVEIFTRSDFPKETTHSKP